MEKSYFEKQREALVGEVAVVSRMANLSSHRLDADSGHISPPRVWSKSYRISIN